MKLLWPAIAQEVQNKQRFGKRFAGGDYGYATQIARMTEAMTAAGVTLCYDEREDFDLAVHFCAPPHFRPIPGRKNIFYTMCETDPLPAVYRVETLKRADVLVVPCRFCKEVYRQFYGGPIEISPEGVDSIRYPFYQRKTPGPGEPFRFLFLGAWDNRKGGPLVETAFRGLLSEGKMPPNWQLRLKISGVKLNGKAFEGVKVQKARRTSPGARPEFVDADRLPHFTPDLPSIVLDTRNLPVEELVQLYNDAHVFVLPTRGEGFGLSLAESLSTGCPSIWTDWSGPRDYADHEIGYPLKPRLTKINVAANGGVDLVSVAEVNAGQVADAMERVYHQYDAALERGRKASERMRRFTWAHAAARFIEICEKYV
jgi:glycosyltransferase involved in cell wall biosynthesis